MNKYVMIYRIGLKKLCNIEVIGLVESPITGPKGNKEFLLYSVLKYLKQ